MRQIDDKCNLTEQCSEAVPNSECRSGTCSCSDGYQVTSSLDACILLIIGDTCNKTVQCEIAVNNSICNSTGSCECVVRYAPSKQNTQCQLNQISSPCSSDAQCSEAVSNSSCVNSICTCESGFYDSNNNTECTP